MTSFATPLVTGTAALLLSYNPNLTTAQIKHCIMQGVDVIPALNGKCVSGGRLNAYKALNYVKNNYPYPPPTPPTPPAAKKTAGRLPIGDMDGDKKADFILPYKNSGTNKISILTYR